MNKKLIILGWARVADPHTDRYHLVVHPIDKPTTQSACSTKSALSGAVEPRGTWPEHACRSCGSWVLKAVPDGRAMWGPTTEQLEALWAYRVWANDFHDYDRRTDHWKERLFADWARAGSQYPGGWAPLQQLRNQFGPTWLAGVVP